MNLLFSGHWKRQYLCWHVSILLVRFCIEQNDNQIHSQSCFLNALRNLNLLRLFKNCLVIFICSFKSFGKLLADRFEWKAKLNKLTESDTEFCNFYLLANWEWMHFVSNGFIKWILNEPHILRGLQKSGKENRFESLQLPT